MCVFAILVLQSVLLRVYIDAILKEYINQLYSYSQVLYTTFLSVDLSYIQVT